MKRLIAVALFLNAALLAGRFFQEMVAHAGVAPPARTAAQNGDVNGDGGIDIADPMYLLFWLFADGPVPVALADSPEILTRVNALEEHLAEAQGDISALEAAKAALSTQVAQLQAGAFTKSRLFVMQFGLVYEINRETGQVGLFGGSGPRFSANDHTLADPVTHSIYTLGTFDDGGWRLLRVDMDSGASSSILLLRPHPEASPLDWQNMLDPRELVLLPEH